MLAALLVLASPGGSAADGYALPSPRRLAMEDYAVINEMLRDVTIAVPPIETAVPVGPFSAWLRVWDLNCSNLAVGEIELSSSVRPDGRVVTVAGAVGEFQIACHGRWSVQMLYYEEGTINLSAQTASIAVSYEVPAIRAEADGKNAWLELGPPLWMDECDASLPLEIDRAEGGLVATAISNPSVEGMLLGMVQDDVNGALCDTLSGEVADALRGMLDASVDFLRPHVRHSYLMETWRAAENERAEEAVRELAAKSNVSLVSLAYNVSTAHALGGAGPLPGSSSVARSANAMAAEARSAESGRIFAVQPLLQALERVINLAADAMAGVGELSVGPSTFGAESLFELARTNDIRILMQFVQITLSGLETFRLTDLTSVVGDYTLRQGFSVADLRIELQMAMHLAPVGADASLDVVNTGAYPTEAFTVTAGLRQLRVELDAILALAENSITSLQLGTVALAPIGCLLTTIFAVVISHLAVSVGDIDFPVVDGFVNEQLSQVLSTLSLSVESIFEPALLAALPSMVEELAVEPTNAAVAGFLAEVPKLLPNACPAVPPELPDGASKYVVFGSNETAAEQLLSRALAMANDLVADDETGMSPLNELVRDGLPMPATLLQLGGIQIKMPDEFHGLAHTIEVVALNLSVWNVDTIHGVEIAPADGLEHVLSATAAIGRPAAPVTTEFYAKVRLWEPAASAGGRRLSEGGQEVPRGNVYTTEEIRITLGASNMRLLLLLLLMIDQQRLAAMYASEALFWQCWLATVAPGGLRIRELLLTLGTLDVFLVECIDCDSSFFNAIADNAAAPGAKVKMHKAIQDGLDVIGALATNEALASLIDDAVAAAPEQCAILSKGGSVEPYRLQPPPLCEDSVAVVLGDLLTDSVAAIAWWHWLIAALVLGTLLTLFLTCFCRRYRRVQQTGRGVGGRAGGVLWEQHVARTTSLFGSRAVPVFAKLCVPLALFANAALFATGHLAVGATVDILLRLGDDRFDMPAYFTFSIAQSTIDMYNSGAVFLAFVVIIFSGVWPYLKLIVMLFLWFAPAYIVRPDNRGSAFAWLDTLGKWSMIDVFVMVLSIVGFNVVVNPPAALDFLWEGLFSVQLLVTPRWGLYANLLAQLVSQLSSHTCLYYHRSHLCYLDTLRRRVAARVGAHRGSSHDEVKTPHRMRGFLSPSAEDDAPHPGQRAELAARFTQTEAREAQARLPLTAHVFSVDSSGRRFAVVRRGYVWALAATLAALVPLILVASVLPNISIAFYGVVGLLMEAHEEGSHTKHFSIVGLGKFIAHQAYDQWGPEAVAFLSVLGMWLTVVLLLVCTIVAPVLQCGALALLHFKRMSRASQVRVYVAVEVITAWSYQEVYIIACVLAISQIETISRFLVQCFCNDLEPIFAALHLAGVLEKEFAECFYSAASFEVAIWLLLLSGVLLSIVTQVMMRSARVAFGQQRFRQDGVQSARPWLPYWFLPGYVAFRQLCTHQLHLVDEGSPPEMREAVARAMGAGGGTCGLPAYTLGPWRFLWQPDAGRVWYWNSRSGERCDAREMQTAGPWGSTLAVGIDDYGAPPAPVPALEMGELPYEHDVGWVVGDSRRSRGSTQQGSASPSPPGTPTEHVKAERRDTEPMDAESAEPSERVDSAGDRMEPSDPAPAPATAGAAEQSTNPPARFLTWVSDVSEGVRNQFGRWRGEGAGSRQPPSH
jgi:hypothetical protein